ncbi:MAG: polar amino acid transport system substrate-binding protein [Marinobacter maritimus]|jgi:polar amino acid transport system substrate-binding protein|uniref:substrate-binding periplasmic protein n=1 Tax=Marinobacter maritimus TaxID=277961 RepID=UPI000BDC678B|nr:transporter substrate-binding domain-containing protein [Marinobacter maritimus]MBL1270971.1 transporter substrate-binding domain-containing protein [Oceanospirillales bacterium]|tara:strand:- start:288 stop:827 length:540 start_codon:yes stop_codon:yes gene_type:complete
MEAEGRYPLLVVILTLALLHLGGCRYPNDVADTTERVTAGTLRVGVAHNPPWVITDHEGTKEPAGIEADWVRDLAEALSAKIEWHHQPQLELLESVAKGNLDIGIAGLVKTAQISKMAALTRPYTQTSHHRSDGNIVNEPHVLALPHGENGWMMTVERLLEARPPRTDVWLAPSEQGAQ